MVKVRNKIFRFGTASILDNETPPINLGKLCLEFATYLNNLGVLKLLQQNYLSGQALSLVLGTKATNPSKPNQHLEAGKIYLGSNDAIWRGRDSWKVFYVNPNLEDEWDDVGVFYIDLNRLQEWRGGKKSDKDFFKGYGGWQQAKDEIGLVTSGDSKTLFGDGTWTFWEIPISSPSGVFNWFW